MKLAKYRKGITPVIAIVLLLMVTVGAVGVVYTQFQSLVGDPTEQIDNQQRNQDTNVAMMRGKSSDTSNPQSGVVVLEIQNTGSVARNTTSFRMVSDNPQNRPGQSSTNGDLCTTDANSTVLDPGQTMDCYTGVDFPSPTDEISLTLDLEGSGKSWEYICRPETSDAVFC